MEDVKFNNIPPEHHQAGEMIMKKANEPVQKIQRIGTQQIIEARNVLMRYKEGVLPLIIYRLCQMICQA